jgi:sugar-specific transcriptional regulator TrmB
MDKQLTTVLAQAGLSDNETLIYIAALELGGAKVSQIAKHAQTERVNTYYHLGQLQKKGFIYSSKEGGGGQFFAVSPRKVVNLYSDRLSQLKAIIPTLNAIENNKSGKPRIRFYEGTEGVKQVYNETLSEKRGGEILCIGSAEKIMAILGEKWAKEYLKRRKGRLLKMRAIIEDSEAGRERKKNDALEMRQTILLPKGKFPFNNEINIQGNKVYIASYGELFGVIIESRDVARTMTSFFELAWVGAKAQQT